jgi:Zn-dependent protease with chaperone function
VLALNGVLALLWRLQVGGMLAYPRWFFETNSVVATAFILGGSWLESLQLRRGGAHVAQMVGGREVLVPSDGLEQRLRNTVQEMAIASGLKPPRVFLLPRDDSINAFAAGWEQHDSVIAVTRGALERLTRDELQGVVAHEFSHILHGDARLNMRLIGHVWGLQLLFMLGRDLFDMTDARGRRSVFVLLGLGLMAVGSIGLLAGRLLKAAVSRQREFLADAAAVQFTRLPGGIGDALRKIAGQDSTRVRSARAEAISHMLLASDIFVHGGALATHPPLAERIKRVFGRPMSPLPSPVLAAPDDRPGGVDIGSPLPWPGAQEPSPAGLTAFAHNGAAHHAHGAVAATGATPVTGAAAAESSVATPPSASVETQRAAQWLDTLLQWPFPPDLAATTLAFVLAPGGGPQTEVWRTLFRDLAPAEQERLLDQVLAVPPSGHLPAFERLLTRCAALPAAERQALRQQAGRIVRADGRLSPLELWRCLLLDHLLDHVLDLAHDSVLRETHVLSLADCAKAIATVTDLLAWQAGAADAATRTMHWRQATERELALALPTGRGDAPPTADELRAAMRRLARLAPMRRPHLLKTWCALVAADERPAAQAVWDSLRCICLLIDTPLPPQLQAQFDAPAAQ